MNLKLTTFPASSIEQYDKLYMIRECRMYSVLEVEHTDEATAIVLDSGYQIALTGIIHPEHLLMLIKEI